MSDDAAARAREVEALIQRAMDPDDPYTGADEDGRHDEKAEDE